MTALIISLAINVAIIHDIKPELLLGICSTESDFRNVVGDDGKSFGICQVQKVAAKQVNMEDTDLMDITTNLTVAAKYIKWNMKRYKTLNCAISAYNAGRCIDGNKYYVDKVNSRMKKFSNLLNGIYK